jgi:histidyl-tRNA synthetase
LRLSREIEDRDTWREARPAQVTVPEADMIAEVKAILAPDEEREAEEAVR